MQRRTFLRKTLSGASAVGALAGLINPFETGRSIGSYYTGEPPEATVPSGEIRNGYRRRTDSSYRLEYEWQGRNGRRWHLDCRVDHAAYEREGRRSRSYVSAFEAARSSPIAARIAKSLAEATPTDGTESSVSPAERLEAIGAFVQSFEYAIDPETKGTPEYHRAVVETLVDGRGDCKDLTYLLAGILSQPPFEYRTAMVFVPEDMLLGVRQADLPAGMAFDTLRGTGYVPIETTPGEPIGTLSRGPLLGIYDRGFEYFDERAAGETAVTFLRNPSEIDIVRRSV
jgi:hypothetical protein